MPNKDVVEELERRFLPALHRMAQEISEKFPGVKASAWSQAVGSLTDYQGHDIGVECLLPSAGPDQPDNIALSISVKHLNTVPYFDAAYVCWGHPSGYVEAELFREPIEVSDKALAEIDAGLQTLYDAFQVAVARGYPSDEQPSPRSAG